MKHKKQTCLAHHMILASCCGLGCANCGVCKCTEREDLVKQGKAPEFGKQYRLTGGKDTACIMNGNSWSESLVN